MTAIQLVRGQNSPLPVADLLISVQVAAPADLSALLVTARGTVRSDDDFVFYNNPAGPGVRLAPGPAGPQAALAISTAAIPADIAEVRTVITLDDQNATFGTLPAPIATVTDAAGNPLCHFRIDGLSVESVVIALELYRRNGAWKVRALGQGYAGGFAALVTDHGIVVEDAPAPVSVPTGTSAQPAAFATPPGVPAQQGRAAVPAVGRPAAFASPPGGSSRDGWSGPSTPAAASPAAFAPPPGGHPQGQPGVAAPYGPTAGVPSAFAPSPGRSPQEGWHATQVPSSPAGAPPAAFASQPGGHPQPGVPAPHGPAAAPPSGGEAAQHGWQPTPVQPGSAGFAPTPNTLPQTGSPATPGYGRSPTPPMVRTAPGEHRLSLEKRRQLDLRKQAVLKVLLTKGAPTARARIVLVIDKTGSMSTLYRMGAVHRVVHRMIPVAIQLDDDGRLEPYLYAKSFAALPAVTVDTAEQWCDTFLHMSGRHGGIDYSRIGGVNNEIPIMTEIMTTLDPTADPTLVLFFTDGGFHEKRKITNLMRRASTLPIFWQFIGLGAANYGLLRALDTMDGRMVDNAGFFAIDDIDRITDDDLYQRLLGEFPDWLRAARTAGILR